jgi:hypothetical protein
MQQILDCAPRDKYGIYGCGGGSFVEAMRYIKDVGLHWNQHYPYEGRKNVNKCLN